MFCLSRPTDQQIRELITRQAAADLSYPEKGASQGAMPQGYAVLHERIRLGEGLAIFERASEALSQWKMFEMPWISLCWPDVPIQAGNIVAILAHHFGFWSLNFSKIVYVLDEDGPICRYGFAYGTLQEHAERGEERFLIEWDRSSGAVWYELLSFSRPNALLARASGPVARMLQRRFARASSAAMVRAAAREPRTW
ncbi:MAG TPA: DUF1990 domain-containing protein [Acidobacteriaceae bacterium]